MGITHRIAIISDIHGNLPAMKAVLDDIADVEVDQVIVAGDMLGRGAEGEKVLHELQKITPYYIKGNHEDYLLHFYDRDVPAEWLTARHWNASRWMASKLTTEDIAFIRSLPFSTTPDIIPGIRIVHGSPFSDREGIGVWTTEDRLREYFAAIDENTLVCAHTHRPMDRTVELSREGRSVLGRVVNIGSVGLPFNGDQRAQYVWVEVVDGEVVFELRHVAYDVDEALRRYQTSGFLAAGNIIAELLAIELRDAVPALVPFEKWSTRLGYPKNEETMERFLEEEGLHRLNWDSL